MVEGFRSPRSPPFRVRRSACPTRRLPNHTIRPGCHTRRARAPAMLRPWVEVAERSGRLIIWPF